VNLHKIDVANITRIFYIISAYFKILHKRGYFLCCIIRDILETNKIYNAQLVLLHNILLTNDILLADVFRLC